MRITQHKPDVQFLRALPQRRIFIMFVSPACSVRKSSPDAKQCPSHESEREESEGNFIAARTRSRRKMEDASSSSQDQVKSEPSINSCSTNSSRSSCTSSSQCSTSNVSSTSKSSISSRADSCRSSSSTSVSRGTGRKRSHQESKCSDEKLCDDKQELPMSTTVATLNSSVCSRVRSRKRKTPEEETHQTLTEISQTSGGRPVTRQKSGPLHSIWQHQQRRSTRLQSHKIQQESQIKTEGPSLSAEEEAELLQLRHKYVDDGKL
eukprot:GHVQ01005338.1.p1 GENE.GHVQ01005338.1~~GHVQ01005338.1.p1  ORF type:complete len:264 (+),score=48.77 GHVQ01005338.1:448-1239(+)